MIGERVSRRAMRETQWIVPTAAVRYVASGAPVFVAALWAGADASTAVLLSALAGAGAPLTVTAVVSSARARGAYARGLVGAHAASDALAAAAFAAALPIAVELAAPSADLGGAIVRFLWVGLGTAALGLVFGLVIARFGSRMDTTGELLLFVLVHVLVLATISIALELSLPLSALVMGAVAATFATPTRRSARSSPSERSSSPGTYPSSHSLAGAESFSGDVVRTAKETRADMVILVVFRPPKEGHALGLRLHPHERIARHLDCPVVMVPVEGGGAEPPRLARLLRRLP